MKKWSFAHFCAYLSLAISITLLVLWCCNVGGFTVVSLDSFVGVIVALLAIIVTMAVGWQIYNSIEIKNRIKELSFLEDKIKEQEKRFGQELTKSEYRVANLWGLSAIKENSPIDAFRYYMISLDCAMRLEKSSYIKKALEGLERSCVLITGESAYPSNLFKEINTRDNSIKAFSYYSFINEQYEKIYNSFISKVKERNE